MHRDAIVIDGHADTISRALDDGEDLGTETGRGHLDLPRMARGGLDAQFLACWVDPAYLRRGQAALRALRLIDAARRWASRYPDKLSLVHSAAEVRRAVSAGRACALLSIEGGHAIEDDLALLRTFRELGVCSLTLTWNNSHGWAESCRGGAKEPGLTSFGRRVVAEMNRLGMLVDLSHASERTFYDALEAATEPVLCTHSCARALCDHVRNLTDDQLRALASNGGVVGVNFYPAFLSDDFRIASDGWDDTEERAAKEAFKDDPDRLDTELRMLNRKRDAFEASLPAPPLERVVDHIEHIAGVAGIDHVGLGSDFDGIPAVPSGLEDCSKLPHLAERLRERGFPEGDVRKILGGNFLRVLEQVSV